MSQVHYLLSITDDISSNLKLMKRLLDSFSKYPEYEEAAIDRFMKDFEITTRQQKKEITRSTKPLLDWAQQVGLMTVQEDDWCLITEKGLQVQKFYSSFHPIWLDQLDFAPAFQAGLLIIYMYAYTLGSRINPNKFPDEARESLKSLNSKFDLWDQYLRKLKQPVDFDLNYDVPLEWRESVLGYIGRLTKKDVDINKLSLWPISQIEERLAMTGIERIQGEFSRALGFSIPRRECFQTDLEWETCIRLRLLRLPANPYQGEFEGETDDPMAEDNPDVVIRNNLKCLVECKSVGEWGRVITLRKAVGGELHMYQSYANEVGANSAIFVCEGESFHDKKFVPIFERKSDELSKIVLVTWNFLDRILEDQNLLKKFVSTIREPESVKPNQRVLV